MTALKRIEIYAAKELGDESHHVDIVEAYADDYVEGVMRIKPFYWLLKWTQECQSIADIAFNCGVALRKVILDMRFYKKDWQRIVKLNHLLFAWYEITQELERLTKLEKDTDK